MIAEPRPPTAPSRNRLVRPSLYRSSATGPLSPDVRDLLIGLTTVADDEGWLLWNAAEIAATIYAYADPAQRLVDLEVRARELVAAQLLEVHDCGCAYLPTLKDQHGIKGGKPTSQVFAWHHSHVGPRGSTWDHVSDSGSGSGSVSGSSSSSGSDSVSVSPRARSGRPRLNGGAAACPDCGQLLPLHAPGCPIAAHPNLLEVRTS